MISRVPVTLMRAYIIVGDKADSSEPRQQAKL